MTQIEVQHGDVRGTSVDLVVLRCAEGYHGADAQVADVLGFDVKLRKGEAKFVSGTGIKGGEALVLGVGALGQFRYEQIQEFGSQAIVLARNRAVTSIAMTMHGPSAGLDVEQAFLSLVAGITTELRRAKGSIDRIVIVEANERRCELLRMLLAEHERAFGLSIGASNPGLARLEETPKAIRASDDSKVAQFGKFADRKDKLFVAMPFADTYTDEFEIGFREAAKASGFVCERLDLEVFSGDIVAEIKSRITNSAGVIALLNDHNPNVFLEVGFAWAQDKVTILVGKAGMKLPFDVSGQRCLMYKNIADLRSRLTTEIAVLKASGMLSHTEA